MTAHLASQKSLRYSLWDAFFYSLMIGVGETYLPAYALSAGMSEWLTGLFATAPLMSGAVLQMATPWMLAKVRSTKRWVVGAVVCQAMAFLPLFYFSLFPTANFAWLFLVAGVYWGANFAAGPAWNLWMQQLVPPENVAHFFALRHRVCQLGIVIGLFCGGLALHAQLKLGPFENVFSLLFLFAFSCRLVSAAFLTLKKDWKTYPIPKPALKEIFDFRKIPASRGFFGFLFVFYLVMNISGPFVTPFFLQKLNLDYSDYMLCLASLFVAKILIAPIAGPLIRKHGVKRVFFWGAMGISPLPMLWPVSDHLAFLMSLQFLSGAFWGLFEVSLSVIFFNHIKPQQKILVLTMYNFFNSSAVIVGSLLGGKILESFNASLGSYFLIFMLGGFLRISVSGWYALQTRNRDNLLGADETAIEEPLSGPIPERVKVG